MLCKEQSYSVLYCHLHKKVSKMCLCVLYRDLHKSGSNTPLTISSGAPKELGVHVRDKIPNTLRFGPVVLQTLFPTYTDYTDRHLHIPKT